MRNAATGVTGSYYYYYRTHKLQPAITTVYAAVVFVLLCKSVLYSLAFNICLLVVVVYSLYLYCLYSFITFFVNIYEYRVWCWGYYVAVTTATNDVASHNRVRKQYTVYLR